MENLNFHHLRYFWAVAREGTLRAAAERLHVSQPSLSAQIKQIEDTLGVALFQRKGRNLVLTDAGRLAMDYADDIFSTAREMVRALKDPAGTKTPVFHVGVMDSLPKLLVLEMLRPALALDPAPRIVCREGQLHELMPLLASHRLDMILADEAVGSEHEFPYFNTMLGSCGITFCALPKLARKLRKNFPQSLDGQPALLPSEASSYRRHLESWFDRRGIKPKVVAEFDDLALMAMFGTEGCGFVPIYSVSLADAKKTFGFEEIGDAPDCRCQIHAITAERKLKHAAIVAVTHSAQNVVFG
jgi:LysR family transcriptional regulator, transcriptional activator of nhaA